MNALSDLQRLDRLESFLAQDAGNESLRHEAFDTAMRAREWARAQIHVDEGLRAGNSPWEWRQRQAHWLMAQHRWREAHEYLVHRLCPAEAPAAFQRAASIDLAQAALHLGDFVDGLARLRPIVEGAEPASPFDAQTQVLWLRLLHRCGRVDEAVHWAAGYSNATHLAPAAAGVASLAALDAGDLALCRTWSDFALTQPAPGVDALVARGSLALADQDAALADRLLAKALEWNPHDGRALSAKAFADLLSGRLPAARQAFEHALEAMPEHIGTWHGLGWAAVLQNDLAGAKSAFAAALALDRNFAESHGALATVQALEGDHPGAGESMKRALKLDPLCLSAHYAKAVSGGLADDRQALQALLTTLLGKHAARAKPAP